MVLKAIVMFRRYGTISTAGLDSVLEKLEENNEGLMKVAVKVGS